MAMGTVGFGVSASGIVASASSPSGHTELAGWPDSPASSAGSVSQRGGQGMGGCVRVRAAICASQSAGARRRHTGQRGAAECEKTFQKHASWSECPRPSQA